MSDCFIKRTKLVDLDGNQTKDFVASLVIDRPLKANSFSGELLNELSNALQELSHEKNLRLLLIQGNGKHFSAGADLEWMKESAKLNLSENILESQKLTKMFELVYNFPKPVISLCKGAIYGGAVGLVAASDYALAKDNTRFCLSEGRIGLIPAVILPYLSRKIDQSNLRRLTLSAKEFSSHDAMRLNLVSEVFSTEDFETKIRDEVNALLSVSPESQIEYKELQMSLCENNFTQSKDTAIAISEIRASEMGKHGLNCFFEKKKPSWIRRLSDEDFIF